MKAFFTPADQRPQRFGWAPGSYLCHCSTCKKKFVGDKRAITCAPCAYAAPDPSPEPSNDDVIGQLQRCISELHSIRIRIVEERDKLKTENAALRAKVRKQKK